MWQTGAICWVAGCVQAVGRQLLGDSKGLKAAAMLLEGRPDHYYCRPHP